MISQKEFLSLVRSNSRIYIDDMEDVWDLPIGEQLGLDSIIIVEILVEIENKYQTYFSFDKLKKIDVKTLRDLWKVICSEEC